MRHWQCKGISCTLAAKIIQILPFTLFYWVYYISLLSLVNNNFNNLLVQWRCRRFACTLPKVFRTFSWSSWACSSTGQQGAGNMAELATADRSRGSGTGSSSSTCRELLVERERSKLFLNELTNFLEGEEYVMMQRRIRELDCRSI